MTTEKCMICGVEYWESRRCEVRFTLCDKHIVEIEDFIDKRNKSFNKKLEKCKQCKNMFSQLYDNVCAKCRKEESNKGENKRKRKQ